MQTGEAKTARVSAEKAYGPRRKDMIVTVERHQLPASLTPKVGQRLRLRCKDGRGTTVTVTDVSPSKVTLDANPPLAGQDLVFDIQLLAILEPARGSTRTLEVRS